MISFIPQLHLLVLLLLCQFAVTLFHPVDGNVYSMQLVSQLLFDASNYNVLTMLLYSTGAVGLLWSFCWFTFTFESPAVHPRISIEERNEIEEAIGNSTSKKRPTYVPWCDMFTSPAVWAIIITHGLSVFGFFTVINQLPTYMHDILNFDIKEVGF